jgi:predicted dithiol-disulfide oxidoreductase (DUF899 family)
MTDHKIGTREEWRAAREQLLVSNKKRRWFYTQQHGDNYTWEVTSSG